MTAPFSCVSYTALEPKKHQQTTFKNVMLWSTSTNHRTSPFTTLNQPNDNSCFFDPALPLPLCQTEYPRSRQHETVQRGRSRQRGQPPRNLPCTVFGMIRNKASLTSCGAMPSTRLADGRFMTAGFFTAGFLLPAALLPGLLKT